MEHRTVSTKLSTDELTLFRVHCEKKGVTPATQIRELILKETKATLPRIIAGQNKISYDKYNDTFSWSINLDSGRDYVILKNLSPTFLEQLNTVIIASIEERNNFIRKKVKGSVPISSNIFEGLI